MSNDAVRFGEHYRILRERREKYGEVVVPPIFTCPCCKGKFKIQEMHRLASTGAVEGAMDLLCVKCARDYRKELEQVARLVCAGCKEVVDMLEPSVEPGGFRIEAGRCYHVAECPCCSSKTLKQSPVVEMILFYKSRGIPYEGAP